LDVNEHVGGYMRGFEARGGLMECRGESLRKKKRAAFAARLDSHRRALGTPAIHLLAITY
jgi:hypothetical protein